VTIEILKWDEVDLSVEARYLGDAAGSAVTEEVDDEEAPHAVDAVQLASAQADVVDTEPTATDSGASVS
jgi:hypothetical protein